MNRLLIISIAVLHASFVCAQIWKDADSTHHKHVLQFSAGVYSGIYKMRKENTGIPSEDIGIDIGVEIRVLLNITKNVSVSVGFVQSTKQTQLRIWDDPPELYDLQNKSSQLPIRFTYSFLTKNQQPILDVYVGLAQSYLNYTADFEYVDFAHLYGGVAQSTTNGPFYTRTITGSRQQLSCLAGLQRAFKLAKRFDLAVFAEYEQATQSVSYRSFFDNSSVEIPNYESNVKLRPTSLRLGTSIVF